MPHKEHSLQKGQWIEIQKPTEGDIEYLREKFPFFHLTNLEDSKERVGRSKLDIYDDYIFMSETIPVELSHGERAINFELSMFLTKDTLITITHETTSLFQKEQEEGDVMASTSLPDTPAVLAYRFLELLYEKSQKTVYKIEQAIKEIDLDIINDRSPKIIRNISMLQRNIIHFITMADASIPHVEELEETEIKFESEDMKAYWGDLLDKLKIQRDQLTNHDRLLAKLAKAHESYMMHHTNYVINILTIVSAVFLPLTFIASVYGMNFASIPGSGLPYGFYGVIAVMAGIGVGLILFFKHKKWL
jgi:magnesium transporter